MKLMSCIDGDSSVAVQGIVNLFWPTTSSILDVTYGKGAFWRGFDLSRVVGTDIDSRRAKDGVEDFTDLSFADSTFPLVVFDPPFQPSTTRNSSGDIESFYTHAPRSVKALEALVRVGLQEVWRVSSDGLVVKVQDYIHDHKPVWMSMWVHDELGEPGDFLVLRTDTKAIAPNWDRQLSIRRNHSTFWIYRKRGKR